MAKFNTNALVGAGLLNQYSQELKENNQIEYIGINLLQPNPKNKFSLTEIDELAESIKTAGLQQPLVVLKNDKDYRIITGHRRYHALNNLIEAGFEKFKNVPCIVVSLDAVKLPVSDELKELYLINCTNKETRVLNDSDIYNMYEDYKRIYQEAKDKGYKLPDSIRNLIASDMKVSPAQVGKMDFITKHGTEELKESLKQGDLSVSRAHQISHLKKPLQEYALKNEITQTQGQSLAEAASLNENPSEKLTEPAPAQTKAPVQTSGNTQDSHPAKDKKNLKLISLSEIDKVNAEYIKIFEKLQASQMVNSGNYSKFQASVQKIEKELQRISKILKI